MTRAERIGEIRQRRTEQARRLEARGAWLAEVLAGLQTIESLRVRLVGIVPDEAKDKLQALGVDLEGLLRDVPVEAAALRVALTRFQRETLNVGVIGRARQGKSRLIRSLTGLTEQEIPTSDGEYCTGVTSVLRHEPGEARAEVLFHTERTFLGEIIQPYYTALGLGEPPATLAAFTRPLAPLNSESTVDAGLYGTLADFHKHLSDYRGLLSSDVVLPIPRHRIRSFVAQRDENEKPLHAFRAVREVRITAPFEHADWTGLSLIDLPGLGDANLRDAERIVAAMRDEIDFVVFVRRPTALGDALGSEDLKLHQYVRAGLGSGPALQDCSFLVVNKCETPEFNNTKQAELMATKWVPGSPFTVARTHIVDCSKSDQVAAVMDDVIEYLLANLDQLDAAHLAARDEMAAQLVNRITAFTGRASHLAEYAQPSSVWFLKFVDLYNETHRRLAAALADLVRMLGEERHVSDVLLYEAPRTSTRGRWKNPVTRRWNRSSHARPGRAASVSCTASTSTRPALASPACSWTVKRRWGTAPPPCSGRWPTYSPARDTCPGSARGRAGNSSSMSLTAFRASVRTAPVKSATLSNSSPGSSSPTAVCSSTASGHAWTGCAPTGPPIRSRRRPTTSTAAVR